MLEVVVGRLVVAAMRRVRRHGHRNARTVALRGDDSLGLLVSIRHTQRKTSFLPKGLRAVKHPCTIVTDD